MSALDAVLQFRSERPVACDSEVGLWKSRSCLKQELRLLKKTERTSKQYSRPRIDFRLVTWAEKLCVDTGRHDFTFNAVLALQASLHGERVAEQIIAFEYRLFPHTNGIGFDCGFISQVGLGLHGADHDAAAVPSLSQLHIGEAGGRGLQIKHDFVMARQELTKDSYGLPASRQLD